METGDSYLASSPPLAMSMKDGGRKYMFFYDIVSGNRYTTKVMPYAKKDFKGISGGFITFENCHGIWFANPVTSEIVEFTKPSGLLSLSDRSILTKVMPHEDYLVLVLYRKCKTIHARRIGAANWAMYSYNHEPWDIVDLVVCDGRVFGLTSDGYIGTIVLSSSSLSFRRCMIENRHFKINARLVASVDEQLMVVEYVAPRKVQISRADMALKEWVIVEDLGNQSLFIDDYKTYRLCDPRGWGGLTNCVYSLHSGTSIWSVFSYTSEYDFHEYLLCSENGMPIESIRGFYFPTLMYSVDRVRDDNQQPQLQPDEGCSGQPQSYDGCSQQPQPQPQPLPDEGCSEEPQSYDGCSQQQQPQPQPLP